MTKSIKLIQQTFKKFNVNVLNGIPKIPHSLNACQIKNTQPKKFILVAFCREIFLRQDEKEQKKIEAKWGRG